MSEDRIIVAVFDRGVPARDPFAGFIGEPYQGKVLFRLPIDHVGQGVGPSDADKPKIVAALRSALESLGEK